MTPKSRWPRPDSVLALLFIEIVLPAAIPDTALPGLQGLFNQHHWPLVYNPLALAVVYVVFESIRCAHPLVGIVVGAFGLLAAMTPLYIGTLQQLPPVGLDLAWAVLVFAGIGALLGLLLGTLAWLVKLLFRRRTTPKPDDGARGTGDTTAIGTVLVAVILLALSPFIESIGLAVQSGLGFREQLGVLLVHAHAEDYYGLYQTWSVLLSLDRIILVALSSLAVYALLRRKPWSKGVFAAQMVVGLLFAIVRVPVLRSIGFGGAHWGYVPTSEYMYVQYMPRPAVSASVLYSIACLEAPVRAIACVVWLPYILKSSKLTEFLRSADAQASPPAARNRTG